MLISEILQLAKDRIIDPNHWCQKHYSLDNEGKAEMIYSSNSTKWCAIGSLYMACLAPNNTQMHGFHNASALLSSAANTLYKQNIAQVNDNLTHEDVIKMYDLAIVNAKELENES